MHVLCRNNNKYNKKEGGNVIEMNKKKLGNSELGADVQVRNIIPCLIQSRKNKVQMFRFLIWTFLSV